MPFFAGTFLTDEDRYDKYLWLLKLSIICTIVHGAVLKRLSHL